MGGFLSRRKLEPRRVALVGLSETGKSHFLSMLCGDGTEVAASTHGPTHGIDRVQCQVGSRPVEFVEFGWTILARGAKEDFQTQKPFDTLVWFIDCHDTLADVHEARSALLGFVETQTIPTALCIVLNKGRPRTHRRVIKGDRWSDVLDAQRGERVVSWLVLAEFADTTSLGEYFRAGIYATEMSYTDPQSAALCLEWIIDPDADGLTL